MDEPNHLPATDPDDYRPWEERGAVRRDMAPHRSNWLRFFGTLALLLGIAAGGGCFFLVVFSIPFGIVIWRLASRDLAKMRAGQMDPNGEKAAQDARACGKVAVFVPLLGLLMWGILVLVVQLLAG